MVEIIILSFSPFFSSKERPMWLLAVWCDRPWWEESSKDKKWVRASADKEEKMGLDFLFQITFTAKEKRELDFLFLQIASLTVNSRQTWNFSSKSYLSFLDQFPPSQVLLWSVKNIAPIYRSTILWGAIKIRNGKDGFHLGVRWEGIGSRLHLSQIWFPSWCNFYINLISISM